MNVLVTGTSSGIGRATALHLATHGFRVFAACRRDADGAELRQMGGERIAPILLDIARDEEIERAVRLLMRQRIEIVELRAPASTGW